MRHMAAHMFFYLWMSTVRMCAARRKKTLLLAKTAPCKQYHNKNKDHSFGNKEFGLSAKKAKWTLTGKQRRYAKKYVSDRNQMIYSLTSQGELKKVIEL